MKPSLIFAILMVLAVSACSSESTAPAVPQTPDRAASVQTTPAPEPTATIPNLQSELLDARNKTTNSPIGNVDFKNHTYELPRGWQNPDGTADFTLTNGRVPPLEVPINEEMADEEKAAARQQRRIGMSYVTTKFLDVTDDGEDEAIVILKIETGGGAVPQIVYVFTWRSGAPELIWPFRTGDRADGGLKDIRAEGGLMVVELYGQDRFLLGQTETGKITGDLEQLCCPTYFTRTGYKWNGNSFVMQGKRLTYSVADPKAAPLENHGDLMNDPVKGKKYLDSINKIR